ncbi:MAG: tetratricopeptide (TPR) repeat protein [Myxococcota bacterium]|jgi:tetratricopeptide (TPR) repeat protein
MFTTLMLLSLVASAGSDADVTAGIVAYEGGDYAGAVAALEEALEDPGQLKSKNVPRANLYLSRALMQQLTTGDPEAPLRAAQAIIAGRAADRGRLSDELDEQAEMVHILLLQGIIGAIRESDRRTIAALEPWADAAVQLVPDDYLSVDLRGQMRARLGRVEEAQADYGAALDLAEAHPPEPPDVLVGYTAFRAATHEVYTRQDADAALALIGRGQALVVRELGRIPEPSAAEQQRHREVSQTLQNLKLDTLVRFPALHDRARIELAAAIAQGESYALLVSYAQLMASTDPEVAISSYERAIATEPGQLVAHFNLGALYANRAAALLQQANDVDDYDESRKVEEAGLDAYRQARPHLERALAISPTKIEIIRALKQIALQLEDMETYQDLRQRETMLQ